MDTLFDRPLWRDPEGRPITAAQAAFLTTLPRHAGSTWLRTVDGDVWISTVFLVHDYALWGEGPPILWETMIFGGAQDGRQRRWTSLADARAGHAAAVAAARAHLKEHGPPIIAVTEDPTGAVLKPTGAATHRDHLIRALGRRRLGRHRARYNRIRRQQAVQRRRDAAGATRTRRRKGTR
jgi:hypothetical protein